MDHDQAINAVEHERRQEAARDHLWLHFSRHSVYEDGDMPVIVRGEGAYIYDDQGRRYLDGLAGCSSTSSATAAPTSPRPRRSRPAQLAFHPLWSYAHPTAIELAEKIASLRPRRPQPGLLHHRRRRGGRVRVEARQELLQAHRQAHQAQGDQPGHRLPRHPPGRALDHRHSRHEGAVRAAGALDVPGAQHQLLPRSRARRTTSRRSAAGPPTGSPRPSSSRARRRWPRSSSSRCRTPAAASRRRPATSSGCARSATATTCCWSPTR